MHLNNFHTFNKSMKHSTLLLGIYFCFCLGCYKYNFESTTEQTFEPKTPCKLSVIVKFKENTENNYLLIGTCEAKATAGDVGNGNANNALTQLELCACENGGDLIKIIDHTANSNVTPGAVIFTGVSAVFNKNAPKKVYKDRIYAEIYIEK